MDIIRNLKRCFTTFVQFICCIRKKIPVFYSVQRYLKFPIQKQALWDRRKTEDLTTNRQGKIINDPEITNRKLKSVPIYLTSIVE
jgi:hypothetical protein